MLFYIVSCEIRTGGPANNWQCVSVVMTHVIEWWGGWLQDGCKSYGSNLNRNPTGYELLEDDAQVTPVNSQQTCTIRGHK